MDYPSGLGRNPVQVLALNVYVLSHHTLPGASSHLKTRQEYFFYDQKSFDTLKTRFCGTWFSTLFGTPFADFSKGKMGYLAKCCSVAFAPQKFCCNYKFY
jgi:hypothetical protein